MSAHTPGPWMTDSSRGWIYSRPGPLTRFVIAEMESGSDEDMALMAAAPELLEALQNALASGLPHDVATAARAAISKATSHTPTSQEREPSATSHAATSPGPVNCNIRLRFQAEAGTPIGKSCARCGIGPCPFFHETGVSK